MKERHPYLLPATIILAGLLLAVAIYVVRSGDASTPLASVGAVRPLSTEDHIIGSPTASVVVVEYSDIDCQYCKNFQEVMTQLVSEYAASGKVAWVYRHFPLVNIHRHAAEHAEAAECVAEQSEASFFPFIDALQQAAPGARQFNPTEYPSLVESLGLSVEAFEECRRSDRMMARVTADFKNATDAGGAGTPYTILLVKGGDAIPVTGALDYGAMKAVLEEALLKAP